MKVKCLIICLLLLSSSLVHTQSQIGLKMGLSSYDLPIDEIDLNKNDLQIAVESASYGLHFGVYLRLGLLGFQLQPEIIFNSNSVQYRIYNINEKETIDELRTEHFQNIDIPVLLMFSPSIFRLYAGPVGHYFLNNISELKNVDGIKEEFKTLTYGYQAGAGIQLAGFSLDVRYEGNFSKFGDHIIIQDQAFHFSSTPSRIIFSLGFKL